MPDRSIFDRSTADLEAAAARAVQCAVGDLQAAGIPIYYMDAEDEIIREEADGRRFVVEIVPGAADRIIRELPRVTKA